MSTREFAAAAVDPETGWTPSKSLVAKIISGQGYNVTPQLVSAIAAGLELDREIVEAAAHLQVIGYTSVQLTKGAPATLIRLIGAEDEPTEKAQEVADRWGAEE
ncbi:hypothetical protein [Streptomyces misionensis]|uniref:hypothetical protein n=1 Tax=Streptomyces misionensis TaxID=67331 RepID=UPI0036C72258